MRNAEWGMRNVGAEVDSQCTASMPAHQFRIPHSEFGIQLPLSRSASATRCSAMAYAAVRNVTPFSLARSRTPT
jgi:hypothetical protein